LVDVYHSVNVFVSVFLDNEQVIKALMNILI